MLYKERAQIAETERECNERFAEAGRQINERIAAAERKESHALQSEGQTTNPNPHDANFAYVICCHCQYRSYYMCGCPCYMLSLFCCIVLGARSSEDYVHCSDPQHLAAGADYIGSRRLSKDILVCTHCQKCAFCRPRYDKCWAEGHLPPLHWKIVMDNMLKETHIMEVLTTKVLKKDLAKKTKMREAYRQHFCEAVPNSNPMEITSPKAKRQCTMNLAHDVYVEKTSTDLYSDKDRARLLDFNKLSLLTPQQQFKDPLSIADAKYHKNILVSQKCLCTETSTLVLSGCFGDSFARKRRGTVQIHRGLGNSICEPKNPKDIPSMSF